MLKYHRGVKEIHLTASGNPSSAIKTAGFYLFLIQVFKISVSPPRKHGGLAGRFPHLSTDPRIALAAIASLFLLAAPPATRGQSAYVRVSQVGYEAGGSPFRAYLMSTAEEAGATFSVINSEGAIVYSGRIGPQLRNWASCTSTTGKGKNRTCATSIVYDVYALDFTVPRGEIYTISVTGAVPATSPLFAVDTPRVLYPGLLLNTLFFYETERDGPNYIPNALRTAAGHLNDRHAAVYITPPLDSNDMITTTGMPLTPTGTFIDASGGWWDAGDYMKYVETVTYTSALMEIGIRDFPNQMGPNAPVHAAAPPVSVSYAGNASGAPASSDFTAEAQFGVDWLKKMWDDKTKTLYYQANNSQDWDNFPNLIGDYDIWRLPQFDDKWQNPGDPEACDPSTTYFICHRPAFIAAPAGSPISPNLAGRFAAAFAEYYQLFRTTDPIRANQALKNAEDIFSLADISDLTDPTTTTNLLTIIPFDGYGESVWDDDMELGATELYFALKSAGRAENLPPGLIRTNPMDYLRQAAQFASNYITEVQGTGNDDTLNLYDVSGLAHFELYRALGMERNPSGLAVTQSTLLNALTTQLDGAIAQAGMDPFEFGKNWRSGDITSHGGGLSVMASEAYHLTGSDTYKRYSRQWLGNILGANSWGSSFIVGDGSTFPNCIQHQVANLAGSLSGTSGGTPILWGAASEGPAGSATAGVVDGMILCPANGVDTFAIFNGVDGSTPEPRQAVYQDNMQSYSTTEPAIDLTSTSFLMFSWRLAGRPSFWTSSTISAHPITISRDDRDSSTWVTATVKSTGPAGPIGRVRFYLGSTRGTLLGEAPLHHCSHSASTATLRLRASDLAVGVNDVVAYFSGDDDNDGPSSSLPVLVTVKQKDHE
jgi:endoglucanase